VWLHDVVYQFASPSKRRQKLELVAGSKKFDIKGEADVQKLNHAVGWRALKGLARTIRIKPTGQRATRSKHMDQTNRTRYCSQHVMTNSASSKKSNICALMDELRVKGVSGYVLGVDQRDGISIIHLKGLFGGGPSNHCDWWVRLIKGSALHSRGTN